MLDLNQVSSSKSPSEILAAVVALRLLADQLEEKTVQKALEQGWTWQQIAEALGVTKQAVHKKHAAKKPKYKT